MTANHVSKSGSCLLRQCVSVPGPGEGAPFGGAKESSYGPREQGLAARACYTESRTVLIMP